MVQKFFFSNFSLHCCQIFHFYNNHKLCKKSSILVAQRTPVLYDTTNTVIMSFTANSHFMSTCSVISDTVNVLNNNFSQLLSTTVTPFHCYFDLYSISNLLCSCFSSNNNGITQIIPPIFPQLLAQLSNVPRLFSAQTIHTSENSVTGASVHIPLCCTVIAHVDTSDIQKSYIDSVSCPTCNNPSTLT